MSKITIDSSTIKKTSNTSIEERISIIEMLLATLKNDIKKDASLQPKSELKTQRPTFGFMKDTGKIIEDVVAPVLDENMWEVLR
jgi:hypothetical protein